MKVTTVGDLLDWLADKPRNLGVQLEVGPDAQGDTVRIGSLSHVGRKGDVVRLLAVDETYHRMYSATGFPTLIEDEEPTPGED